MDKILICSFPPWGFTILSLVKEIAELPNSEQDPNRRNSSRKWRILLEIRVQNNISQNFCSANFHFSSAFCATWAQFVKTTSKSAIQAFLCPHVRLSSIQPTSHFFSLPGVLKSLQTFSCALWISCVVFRNVAWLHGYSNPWSLLA